MSDYIALTARQAAELLHARINERHLPHVEEIEAVLEKMATHINVVGTQIVCERCLAPPSDVAARIRDLLPRLQDASLAASTADAVAITEGRDPDECAVWQQAETLASQLRAELETLRKTAWLRAMLEPSLDGLVLLAEIAQHYACDWRKDPSALADPATFCDETGGALVMAVLRYGGYPFSVHGEAWDEEWSADDEQDADGEGQP